VSPHIVVRDLTKTFHVSERGRGTRGAIAGLVRRRRRVVRALDGVSFDIPRGDLVGYIGPNGAGKSTTIKILSGILVPDAGVCEVDGRVPWKDRREHVGRIGVVFGQRTQLWWDLPVIESFELLRDIYSVPSSRYRVTLDRLVQLLDLAKLLDVPVRQLSLGQRMRCDLVAALLHEPQLLFLDEPTIGLDAFSKLAMRDFIRELNTERGVTVILTTHDMDDIEALCRRLIILGEGRVVSDGSINDIRRRIGNERRLTVDLEDDCGSFHDPDARVVEQEGHRVRLSYDPSEVSSADLVRRIMDTHRVRDLYMENPPIEEIIARIYAEQPEGEE